MDYPIFFFSLLVEHIIQSFILLLIIQHSVSLSIKLSTRSNSTKQDNPQVENHLFIFGSTNTYYWPNIVPVFC